MNLRLNLIRIILLVSFMVNSNQALAETLNIPNYRIGVEVNPAISALSGTVYISALAGSISVFHLGDLKVTGLSINGRETEFRSRDNSLSIISETDSEIRISYSGVFNGKESSPDNPGVVGDIINREGLSLTGIWYPKVDGLHHYNLEAILPAGFKAVSEADVIREKSLGNGKVKTSFEFKHPLDGITLTASDRFEVLKDSAGGVELYAYFFPEDAALARKYIEYAKEYIALYEGMLGKYPYKRFSIVENFLPSGYSMPTYTLLGSSVVRLPFIVETSLGHEILHQWFGNNVYIDYEGGNWAEGLTTYLADHWYKEQKGSGWEYRKGQLADYLNYVQNDNELAVKDFISRTDKATSSVGYGKVSMLFHMLRKMHGDEMFFAALKGFLSEQGFSKGSWRDLQNSFERVYGEELEWFFSQWLQRTGLPALNISGAGVTLDGLSYRLEFSIEQEEAFYRLGVPVRINFSDRHEDRVVDLEAAGGEFEFLFDERPLSLELDRNYDMARRLVPAERAAVIAGLLGSRGIIVVGTEGDKDKYAPVIKGLAGDAGMRDAGVLTHEEMKDNSFVILGSENPLALKMFGTVKTGDGGFNVKVMKNPWNTENVVAIIEGRSADEVSAAFRKVFHYGKYSSLSFEGGRVLTRETEKSERGINMRLIRDTAAIELSKVSTLSDVIDGILDKKIVYVGEAHDEYAHHEVQLEIITAMYRKNKKVAIGMEMFQRPFQEVLDSYIAGDIEEAEFLRRSEYFKRWRFDYNLYKPILDFARAEKLPVVALNLQKEIIEKISRKGIQDLDVQDRAMVPAELDMTDDEYCDRLFEVFQGHDQSEMNLDFFYQAQITWDETMAESVDGFMKKNPDYQMVVVVGRGHLEYRSGIPNRVKRRNALDSAVVLLDAHVDRKIADYIVYPEKIKGKAAPQMQVYLKESEGSMEITGFPTESVSEKAGMKAGDVLVSIDGQAAPDLQEIKIILHYKEVGDTLKVKVLRKDEDTEDKSEIVIDIVL